MKKKRLGEVLRERNPARSDGLVSNRNPQKDWDTARLGLRIHSISEICLKYEGADEAVVTRVPDISTSGMLINAAQIS
jgi:hypothetical protein